MFRFVSKIKIRHRLLTRLLLSYIFIVSLPLLFTGKVLVDTAQDSIENNILDRNLQFTVRSTRLIELKLQFAKDIIQSQTKNQTIYEMNKGKVELAINIIKSEFSDLFNKLMVIDTTGEVMASTAFEETSLPAFAGNGIVSSILNGISYQSDVYVSEEHLPLMDIGEPIKLHDEVVGILYAVVDLKAMWELVRDNVVGRKGEAFIFNKAGVFIAHSDPKKVYSKQEFKNTEILHKIRLGENGATIYKNEQNIEMVAAFAPIGDYGWGAMIQQPTSEAFAKANSMRLRVMQFMIVSVLLASLVAYFYSRLIVKPVNHLVSGMDEFAKGELHYRIQKVSNDEIGTLAENFNEMADRLIEYQNTLKRTERLETLGKLASVLSHEIRNPLNSMVINMQILKRELSRPKVDREKVDNFYEILASEIKRVDQLVSDFLLFARPKKMERARVPLNEILDEVVMMQIADSLKKGVRVEREYHNTPVEANVDVDKMRQAFLNLYINAIQAMPGGGKLTIALRKSEDVPKSQRKLKGKSIIISFGDTGQGIKKEILHKIFDFYYSTKKSGTGVGLAIVQQIVEEHHGIIHVESKIDQGTQFTIHLPRE
ncbi:MAG: ATP-binding protein [bacterium]